MDRCLGRQVPCPRTFVNAVKDYGSTYLLLVLPTEIETVQDLAVA
jgi:hypothetical protein